MLYNKQEAEQKAKRLMRENCTIVKDFNEWMHPKEEVRVVAEPKQYPMGYGIAAKLYFGESLVREYDFAEHAYLDLNEMVLKQMLKRRDTDREKTMTWKLSYINGAGAECPPKDIDYAAKKRIVSEILQGQTHGSLGDDDFFAPTPKKELIPKSNLEAIRNLPDEKLSMVLMCPYADGASLEHRMEDVCAKFTNCRACTSDFLLQPYEENHSWFKEEEE